MKNIARNVPSLRDASRSVASAGEHWPALSRVRRTHRYAGIQGTSTPGYYRVLLNECRLAPLDVIELTLALHYA